MIEYARITESDMDEVISLYEKYLNSGKYVEDMMRREFESEDYLGFKACNSGQIVGFFFGQKQIEFTYPHPELEEEIRRVAGDHNLYTPDGLLILDGYRGEGIGRELIRRMKEQLIEKCVELALVELWIYPDGKIPAKNPLKGIGEAVYEKTVPMFYKDLPRYGMECPLCGKNCRCGALIQLLKVTDFEHRNEDKCEK